MLNKETIKKLMFWRRVFVDGTGKYTGFKWWWRWTRAHKHWYKWLRYEGMPENITDVDEMHDWNRRLIKWQDGEDVEGFPKWVKD